MKLELGKDIEKFSNDLASALANNFDIQEYVWDYREYINRDVDHLKISDFIQQFIGSYES